MLPLLALLACGPSPEEQAEAAAQAAHVEKLVAAKAETVRAIETTSCVADIRDKLRTELNDRTPSALASVRDENVYDAVMGDIQHTVFSNEHYQEAVAACNGKINATLKEADLTISCESLSPYTYAYNAPEVLADQCMRDWEGRNRH